ncbi:MAG: hypothetical protein K6C06_04395 [Lachnospiraceae bacterium]|nr:hypothetical protein [Lachnospiraceae bacterium]
MKLYKKITYPLLLLGASALLLAGCSQGKKEDTPPTESDTVSGVLIDKASSYVTLGEYTGLEVERATYEVTDYDVDSEIESRLSAVADYEELKGPAQSGDLIEMKLTVTPEGSDPEEYEEYVMELGAEEFDLRLDEAIEGRSVGDNISITIPFDEDSWVDDWVGKDVAFDITITSISRARVPELTDEYAKSSLGYNTADEYRAAIREELEKEYRESADIDVMETLVTDAMDNCTFNGYPEDLYTYLSESRKAEYESFAEMMGLSIDEFYKEYMMTDEDVRNEVLTEVNRRLFISAVCEKENLKLTQDEYNSKIEALARSYGYNSAEDLTSVVDAEELMWEVYGQVVGGYLLDNAKVTDIVMDYTEEDLGVVMDLEGESEVIIDGSDADVFEEEIYDADEETEDYWDGDDAESEWYEEE